MSEKTLKSNNIRLNEKEFHKSKETIDLMLYLTNLNIIMKANNKYLIGYQEGGIVKRLCIILSQMSRYIKYFENESKNMSFLIKDDEVWEKYDKIWDAIKYKLGIKFHSKPAYEYKYLKAKIKEFDSAIKTNFLGNDMPKENMHYKCIACITIDSVMGIDKNKLPQAYFEECKIEPRTYKCLDL